MFNPRAQEPQKKVDVGGLCEREGFRKMRLRKFVLLLEYDLADGLTNRTS